MTAVWKMDLPASDKMVLLALADAANDDGVTWIAVSSRKQGEKLDLKKKCSLSERAIQGAIKRLCEAGHLARVERPGKGVIYTVTPAASAPRSSCTPADDDMNPRSSCGETVNNHQPSSEAKASSEARAIRSAKAEAPTAALAEQIWSLQPVTGGKRKAARPDVRKALDAAIKRGGIPGEILAALTAYYRLPDCRREEGRFASGAAVMLHNDRWRDFLPRQTAANDALNAGPVDPAVQARRARRFRDTGVWEPGWGPKPTQPDQPRHGEAA